MTVLRCRNPECPSHDGSHLFTIHCTVGDDREPAESLRRVEPHYFTCCFCGDAAIDKEEA